MKHRTFIYTFLLLTIAIALSAQSTRNSREDYIQKYKHLAIKQMKISGIPASIIMGQACFESDNGNSRLAREANNHFGIKCHSTWKGPSIRHDDDALQECFRKYPNPEGSFSDHSDFLRYRDRYAFLFDLPRDDYKGWAEGLKKAGYATNPLYAERLIKIIEDNRLYELDKDEPIVEVKSPKVIELEQTVEIQKINIDSYAFMLGRQEYRRNGVRFVQARNNDSYDAIAVDMNIKAQKLLEYNDVSGGINLKAGDVVYLEPKKSSTVEGLPMHIAEFGETMWGISQRFGIKLKDLYKYNNLKVGQEPMNGEAIFLRKKKKSTR